jgi:hypothetical protein
MTSKSVGSAEVGRDQILQTDRGRAEMLLTPGVFVRLDEHSAVRMVSPELIDTQVEVTKGRALIEVTDLLKNNHLVVRDNAAAATLKKNGVYAFNADQPYVRVFDGKADVVQNDQRVELNKGKEVNLNQSLKVQKFDRKAAQESDPLYRWSSLRSQYLEQASIDAARVVVVNHAWGGPGWYWDPYWGMYSFLPGSGFLYSPFGYGYYSPIGLGFAYGYPRYYRTPVIVGRPRVQGVAPRSAFRGNGGFHSNGFHGGGGRGR